MKKLTLTLVAAFLIGLHSANAIAPIPCSPNQGCTGINQVPVYGQVLVGNYAGTYTLTATSSLGITGGSSAQYFTVTGVSLNQNTGSQVQIGNLFASSTAVSTIANFGGVLDASAFTGADIFAQANAAYAWAVTNGFKEVTIKIPAGNYTASTNFVCGTNGFRCVLQGQPGGGTTVNFTGTGGATTQNFGIQGTGIDHQSGCGLRDITLIGNNLSTSSPQIGEIIGGTNGTDCSTDQNVTIEGFGYGIQIVANAYHYANIGSVIRNNGQNLHVNAASNSGEDLEFINDMFVDGANHDQNDCLWFDNSATENTLFVGGMQDDCQAHYLQANNITEIGVSHENVGFTAWNASPYILLDNNLATNLSVNGSTFFNDAGSTQSPVNFISNGGNVTLNGVIVRRFGGFTITNFMALTGSGRVTWSGLNNVSNAAFTNVVSGVPYATNGSTGSTTLDGAFNLPLISNGCLNVTGGIVGSQSCASGGSGSGNVSTSTVESAGQVAFWTSNGGTPALLGEEATGTIAAGTGISVSGTPYVLNTGTTITNTGVTSIVAGSNITISGGTGAVTINSSGGGGGTGIGWASSTIPDTNSIYSTQLSNVGIGSTTPWAKLAIGIPVYNANVPMFAISSSTSATATSTPFIVAANSDIGLGTNNPTFPVDQELNKAGVMTEFFQNLNGNQNSGVQIFLGDRGTAKDQTTGAGIEALRTDLQNFFGTTDLLFQNSFGNTLNNNMIIKGFGAVGVGTTTPWGDLSVSGNTGIINANGLGSNPIFVVGSSTNATYFMVTSPGKVGIGTTSPGTLFSLGNTGASTINIDPTATSTFGSGININTGCFAIANICLSTGGGGGTVTAVTGSYPIVSSGGTAPNITYSGLATTSPWTNGQVAEVTSNNQVSSVATSSFANGTNITVTNGSTAYVLGAQPTINISGVIGIANGGTNTGTIGASSTVALSNGTALNYIATSSLGLQTALTLTTSGTSGASTLSALGVLNIPQYSGGGAANTNMFASSSQANSIYANTGQQVGIGSSTPWANLSVGGGSGSTIPLFAVGTSSAGLATTTPFQVMSNGNTNVLGFLAVGPNSVGSNIQINGQKNDTALLGLTAGATSNCQLIFAPSTDSIPRWCVRLSSTNGDLDFDYRNSGSSVPTNAITMARATGYIGIGSTTPEYPLSVEGISSLGNQARAGFFSATSTLTASTFPYASTTMLSAITASTTNLVIGQFGSTQCLQVSSLGVVTGTGSTCSSGGSAYPFGLAGNATSTLTQFNGGLTAYASSTIGNGGATAGLTINGTATTSGNAIIATTSATALVVQDNYKTADLTVNTASTTGPILDVQATTSTAANLVHLFQIDQYGHLTASSTGATPTISSCGTGNPVLTVTSNDVTGDVTTGTSATACTITYGTAYLVTPEVFISDSNTSAVIDISARSTTGFTVSIASALSAVNISYLVIQP